MEGALKFRTMSEAIDEASRQASAARIAAAAESPPIMVTRAQAAMFSQLPTPNDLAEASKLVTGWIKTIRDSEPDPGKRLDRASAFIKGLIKDVKATRPPAPKASGRGDSPDVTRASQAASSIQRPQGSDRPPPASPPAHPAQSTMDRPPTAPDIVAGSALDSTAKDSPVQPANGAAPIEHPDDAKRRKKRELELEERKKKRNAVLGRRNKGRTR